MVGHRLIGAALLKAPYFLNSDQGAWFDTKALCMEGREVMLSADKYPAQWFLPKLPPSVYEIAHQCQDSHH